MEKGRALPGWFLEEPLVLPGDDFYLQAFRDLNTCRDVGWNIGPIPWRDVVAYSSVQGLDAESTRLFIEVIRTMDQGYLIWREDNTDG